MLVAFVRYFGLYLPVLIDGKLFLFSNASELIDKLRNQHGNIRINIDADGNIYIREMNYL